MASKLVRVRVLKVPSGRRDGRSVYAELGRTAGLPRCQERLHPRSLIGQAASDGSTVLGYLRDRDIDQLRRPVAMRTAHAAKDIRATVGVTF